MAWKRPSGQSATLPRRPPPAERNPGSTERAGVLGGRRRARPTGRTVVGGFLVAAAAVIVFSVTLSDVSHRGQPVVVAARALPAGTVIGPGDTTTESLSLPAATKAVSFRDQAGLVGRTLAASVYPGELIQSSMLEPPSGVTSAPSASRSILIRWPGW